MTHVIKVLLASDNSTSGALWDFRRQDKNYVLVVETNLDHVPQRCLTENPNLVILDLAKLDNHAYNLIRELRQEVVIPVLVLSSTQDPIALIEAYHSGADDCVVKPFDSSVLQAKIYAWLRRWMVIPVSMLDPLQIGRLHIYPLDRLVTVDDHLSIHLTNMEMRLLYILMSRAGRTVPADELIQLAWGSNKEVSTAVLKNMVYRLRQKFESEPVNINCIHTVPGSGYRFDHSEHVQKT